MSAQERGQLYGDVWITLHGGRRARERLGLKKRAVPRAVATAWRVGRLQQWCELADTPGRRLIKVWRGARFIFQVRNGGPALITVLPGVGEREG